MAEEQYDQIERRKKADEDKEKERVRRKKNKEESDAALKQKIEENFRKWLKTKKKRRIVQSPHVKNKVKIKKPVMLAYSPNRKSKKESKYQTNLSSYNDTPASSISDNQYVRQISSKPKLYTNYTDLSSISNQRKIIKDESSQNSENYDNDVFEDEEDEPFEDYDSKSIDQSQESEVYESSYIEKGLNSSF
jgi:hypothetical protein